MKNKKYLVIAVIALVIIIIVGYFILNFFQGKPEISGNVTYVQINTSEIGSNQISYLLYSIKADSLHNLFYLVILLR